MYIEAFVAAVPTANKQAYVSHATQVAAVFKKHGALQVVENWGVDVPDGEYTSFIKAVQCEEDETVVVAWIVWPSKEVREQGMASCMDDPLFQPGVLDVPFDGKRLIMGGFEQILKL